MSNTVSAPYEQSLQNSSDASLSLSMDTSPISSDISSSYLSLPDPAVSPQFQDQTAVSAMIAPMHLSMPDLSSSSFLSQMDADPVPHLHTAPPGFLPDTTHPDPFNAMSTNMSLEMSPGSVALSSPSSHSQLPSPSVRGVAPPYPPGVTSSLDSALDPTGVSGNRSRANTSVSPTSIPPSFLSMTPPTQQQQQQSMALSFHPSDPGVAKQEEEAHILIGEILKDIAKTASSAGDDCKNHHPAEASYKVDELKERISQVSEMISMMSVASSNFSPSFSSQASVPSPLPPSVSEPPVDFPSVSQPAANSPIDLRAQLTVPDHSRKRCASDLEEQRTVKAPKREPQDDQPLSFAPSIEAPVPLPVETSQIFPTAGISLPQGAALPLAVSQSRPPSRPPTPSSFAVRPSYSPTKQSQTSVVSAFPSYASAPPAPIDFATSISSSVASGSPTFPGLHTSWTDTAVPTVSSRHHASSSVGSVTGVITTLPAMSPAAVPPAAMDPYANTLTPTTQVPPQAIPIANPVSAVSQPVGRMSRSGSINGASFASAFTFGYPPADTSANWSSMGRLPNTAPAPHTGQTSWYVGGIELSRSSASPSTSDAAGTMPSTTRNSPSDDENDDDEDSDDNETTRTRTTSRAPAGDAPSNSSSSSDVPAEYKTEVDRIFFEYLNKICSNLEATDSKGEPIHQTLMAKKMQRLDESPDFRPFKFRIQAFTLAFLEELARQGYPEEKIPMKKVRNYLWRQQYILRFNEDGKKAKSKGNHIWNIEAKKAGDGKWEFRPFHRKLVGTPPPVAYSGLKWHWTPRIWDPQASWQNIPVQYSSPNLPSWLSWKDDVLSGIPPPDAESCQITVIAKFTLDGQEGQLSQTFPITVAPMTTLDSSSYSRSRRPSLAGEPPKRSTSDSALFQVPQRSKVRAPPAESPDTRVIRVLQSVAQRVSEEAASQFVLAMPPKETLQDLVKQRHVLEQTVHAYDKEISGMGHAQTRQLAVAAQNVVVQAAHTVIADRSLASGMLPPRQPETATGAIQSVTVNELTNATQGAIAMAVKSQGTASTEVDIIVAAASILKARTSSIDATSNAVAQAAMQHSLGAAPMLNQSISGYPSNLSSLPEYS
ncbi:hypothetical protein BDQ17DRAFT_1296044 [Cyathus striatus]|nr:hypothetical protein BDQ17DRAFT_1296044 [Cyathus striatus]